MVKVYVCKYNNYETINNESTITIYLKNNSSFLNKNALFRKFLSLSRIQSVIHIQGRTHIHIRKYIHTRANTRLKSMNFFFHII